MEPSAPSPADLIIAPDSISGRGYTLSVAPDGPSQLWYASYPEALKAAQRWSETTGVSVWRAKARHSFECVHVPEPRGSLRRTS